MRLRSSLILLAGAAVLAACATPAPDPAPPATPELVAFVGPPEPPLAILDPPIPLIPDPFPAGASADLEMLPAPQPDLWERIIAGYAMPDRDGPLVEKWEQWYAARPDYVARRLR